VKPQAIFFFHEHLGVLVVPSGQFLFRGDLPGHRLLHGDHSVVVLGWHRSSQQPLVISNGFASPPVVCDFGVGLITMKCKGICSLDVSYLPKNYCLAAKKVEESKGKGKKSHLD
jgi:hypothetical protein